MDDVMLIGMWLRCQELAKLLKVTIEVKSGGSSGFDLTFTYKGRTELLGKIPTVEGLYGFLCGFEHYFTLLKMKL